MKRDALQASSKANANPMSFTQGLCGRPSPLRVFFVASLLLGMMAAIAQEAGRKEPPQAGALARGRVEGLTLVDPALLERERRLNAIIQSQFADGKGQSRRFRGKQLTDLSPRDAALRALRKNLGIKRSQVAEQIARAALLEAQAVFDPVLLLSFTFDRFDRFDRIETAEREVRATTVGDADGDGTPDNILSTDVDNPADPRDVTVDFQQPRQEGTRRTPVLASQAPLTGPTDTFTYGVQLEQQLPWGAGLVLTYQAVDEETFFINNFNSFADNPDPPPFVSFGSYDRPWVSSLLTTLVAPLPYSKDFGPYADQEVAIKLADLSTESAFWQVESVINNTLLSVDIAFWDFVNSLLGLNVTIENRKGAEQLLQRTKRFFDLREATNYDLAQVEAELARVQGEEEQAWNNYVVASNVLVELLDMGENQLLLPKGYTAALQEAFPIDVEGISRIGSRENPDLAAAGVAVKAARIEQQRRAVRTRPDVNFLGQALFSQSNQRFGYKSFGESTEHLFDPDTITQQYALAYTYPWGNRAVKAALSRAQNDKERTDILLGVTDNGIHRDINNALIALLSSTKRIAITEQNVKLAQLAYDSARRRWAQRAIAQYEVVTQNANLLTARLNHIQAQTERKQSEAQVLAALGTLAKAYAQRYAQTDWDRYRLSLMQANGVLRHFGGPDS